MHPNFVVRVFLGIRYICGTGRVVYDLGLTNCKQLDPKMLTESIKAFQLDEIPQCGIHMNHDQHRTFFSLLARWLLAKLSGLLLYGSKTVNDAILSKTYTYIVYTGVEVCVCRAVVMR